MTVTETRDEVSLFGPLVPWPNRLLTPEDWDALPAEGVYRRAELDEGVLILSPNARSDHRTVAANLLVAIKAVRFSVARPLFG